MHHHFAAATYISGADPHPINFPGTHAKAPKFCGPRVSFPALMFAALACLVQPLHAQQTATVSGNLSDLSGGAISGATLTLTNEDTAVAVATAKSDSGGSFAFQAVPAPGTESGPDPEGPA